jgi:hypothetical protein
VYKVEKADTMVQVPDLMRRNSCAAAQDTHTVAHCAIQRQCSHNPQVAPVNRLTAVVVSHVLVVESQDELFTSIPVDFTVLRNHKHTNHSIYKTNKQ